VLAGQRGQGALGGRRVDLDRVGAALAGQVVVVGCRAGLI